MQIWCKTKKRRKISDTEFKKKAKVQIPKGKIRLNVHLVNLVVPLITYCTAGFRYITTSTSQIPSIFTTKFYCSMKIVDMVYKS